MKGLEGVTSKSCNDSAKLWLTRKETGNTQGWKNTPPTLSLTTASKTLSCQTESWCQKTNSPQTIYLSAAKQLYFFPNTWGPTLGLGWDHHIHLSLCCRFPLITSSNDLISNLPKFGHIPTNFALLQFIFLACFLDVLCRESFKRLRFA